MGIGIGLVLGLVLEALGGFFFLPIACTIWGGSYDGLGMILYTIIGLQGGTIVGGAPCVAAAIVGVALGPHAAIPDTRTAVSGPSSEFVSKNVGGS